MCLFSVYIFKFVGAKVHYIILLKVFSFRFRCKSYVIVFVDLVYFGSCFSSFLKMIYYFCHRNKLANELNYNTVIHQLNLIYKLKIKRL